jgi:hypothetical protein
MFRPRGFSPPRRLSPRPGPRACCIPLPVLGFAAFPATCSQRPETRATRRRSVLEIGARQARFPRRNRPFEEFPPPAAVPCHHGPLPPCRQAPLGWSRPLLPVAGRQKWCGPKEALDFEVLLRERVRCARHPFGCRIARSFHGLVSPSRPDALRGLPDQRPSPRAGPDPAEAGSRGDPTHPAHRFAAAAEGARRPALARWRFTAFEPRTSLPCGSLSGGVVDRARRRGRPPWGSRR